MTSNPNTLRNVFLNFMYWRLVTTPGDKFPNTNYLLYKLYDNKCSISLINWALKSNRCLERQIRPMCRKFYLIWVIDDESYFILTIYVNANFNSRNTGLIPNEVKSKTKDKFEDKSFVYAMTSSCHLNTIYNTRLAINGDICTDEFS